MVKKIQVGFSDELFGKLNELRKGKYMSAEEFAIDAVRHQVMAAGAKKPAVQKKFVLEDIYSRPRTTPKAIEQSGVGK